MSVGSRIANFFGHLIKGGGKDVVGEVAEHELKNVVGEVAEHELKNVAGEAVEHELKDVAGEAVEHEVKEAAEEAVEHEVKDVASEAVEHEAKDVASEAAEHETKEAAEEAVGHEADEFVTKGDKASVSIASKLREAANSEAAKKAREAGANVLRSGARYFGEHPFKAVRNTGVALGVGALTVSGLPAQMVGAVMDTGKAGAKAVGDMRQAVYGTQGTDPSQQSPYQQASYGTQSQTSSTGNFFTDIINFAKDKLGDLAGGLLGEENAKFIMPVAAAVIGSKLLGGKSGLGSMLGTIAGVAMGMMAFNAMNDVSMSSAMASSKERPRPSSLPTRDVRRSSRCATSTRRSIPGRPRRRSRSRGRDSSRPRGRFRATHRPRRSAWRRSRRCRHRQKGPMTWQGQTSGSRASSSGACTTSRRIAPS